MSVSSLFAIMVCYSNICKFITHLVYFHQIFFQQIDSIPYNGLLYLYILRSWVPNGVRLRDSKRSELTKVYIRTMIQWQEINETQMNFGQRKSERCIAKSRVVVAIFFFMPAIIILNDTAVDVWSKFALVRNCKHPPPLCSPFCFRF